MVNDRADAISKPFPILLSVQVEAIWGKLAGVPKLRDFVHRNTILPPNENDVFGYGVVVTPQIFSGLATARDV
jgi:hypothetical protein